jgi:two-component system, chemotaxis family, chemotaxis protein CheY
MTKILVVDDAAFMRMKAVKILKENGYEVVEAATGQEAVDQYKKEKPDGVLMDIDGLAALKMLKEFDSKAKVTMVTAMGQQAIVMEALKSGALDFIVKPFDPARIKAAVEKMVA